MSLIGTDNKKQLLEKKKTLYLSNQVNKVPQRDQLCIYSYGAQTLM